MGSVNKQCFRANKIRVCLCVKNGLVDQLQPTLTGAHLMRCSDVAFEHGSIRAFAELESVIKRVCELQQMRIWEPVHCVVWTDG